MSHSPPAAERRVLPTLNQDGSRRRIRPELFLGKHQRRRKWVGWALMIIFIGLPFVKVGDHPAVLLDLAAREFTFFGRTFFATDGVLLMLLMLSIFVAIIAVTAIVGRAWCGWGCPQTVYMEFLFRPVERFFEGDRNSQLRLDRRGIDLRRVSKNFVFSLLSVFVANVFLAYFVGVETLSLWMSGAPSEHPGGFAVMGVTAALVFFDFAYFREQMCTVICPYARLQAALLDKDSLVVGYDEQRGEPRHKGKPTVGSGDCIDCSACVRACPTGIDIREGLQLECIACTQCIDACDSIMAKVKKPPGLIRYASQNSLSGGRTQVRRLRVFAYSVLLVGLLAALMSFGRVRTGADVTVLRGIGAPFVLQAEGVRNQIRVKVENRSNEDVSYSLEILFGDEAKRAEELGIRTVIPENPIKVESKGRRTTSVFLISPQSRFENGRLPIFVRLTEPSGSVVTERYHLLGPEG